MGKEKNAFWFMRQAGRYLPEYKKTREQAGGFLNLCFNPALASEVTLQPIRRFGFSHAIIFSDILTIPFALGYNVKIDEAKGGPLVETFKNSQEIFDLKSYDTLKINPVLEAIKQTRKNLPVDTQLIGFCGAPWTLAVYMLQGKSNVNNADTHIFAYEHSQEMDFLIQHLTDVIIDYLGKQIEAGCDTIQLFDSWASFLSPELFEKYVIIPHHTIFTALKAKYPHIVKIGFPRGASFMYEDYAKNSACDVMGVDQGVSIKKMQYLQKICGIQGNLDPFLLIAGGQDLTDKTHKLMRLYDTGHYIFNLGHGILPQTPTDHVDRVVKILKSATD